MQHLKHLCAALTLAALCVLSFGSHSSVFAQGLTIGKLHLNDPHLRIVIPCYGPGWWSRDRYGEPQYHYSGHDTGAFVADLQVEKYQKKTFSVSFDTGHINISAEGELGFSSFNDTYRFNADYDSVNQMFTRLSYFQVGLGEYHDVYVQLGMRDVPLVIQDTALIIPPMSLDSMRAKTTSFTYRYTDSWRSSGATINVDSHTADSIVGSMQLMLSETFMASVKPQKLNQAAALQIFPNPASNQVQITSSDKLSALAIRDVTGRIVFDDRSAPASSHSIDTRAFPNGTYFVTGRVGSRDVVAKFVINRW